MQSAGCIAAKALQLITNQGAIMLDGVVTWASSMIASSPIGAGLHKADLFAGPNATATSRACTAWAWLCT